VVGTTCALDFHMSLDGGVCMAGEAGSTVGGLEGPAFPVVYSPVFARDPVFLLVGVAGDCPSLQHLVDGVVKGFKDPGTGHMRVVIAPAHNLGIQRLNQRLLRCVLVMVNRLAQFGHMSSDCRLTGLINVLKPCKRPRQSFPEWVFPAGYCRI